MIPAFAPACAFGRHGRKIDDTSLSPLHHMRHHCTATEKSAFQITINDLFPQVIRNLVDLIDANIATATRVVDQNIDCTIDVEPTSHHRIYLASFSYISGDIDHLTTVLLKGGSGVRQFLRLPIRDDQLGACRSQSMCNGLANALGGTRYERYFPIQPKPIDTHDSLPLKPP
jgi:hypothetical protein